MVEDLLSVEDALTSVSGTRNVKEINQQVVGS